MQSEKKNFVLSVFCPIGGQGQSFFACQLANQLSRYGTSCLIDLNLDLSMSLLYLNKEPQKAFRESALASGESSKLSSFAIKIKDDYYALGAPLLGYGQFAEDLDEALKELFNQCREEFNFTVIDLPHSFHLPLVRKTMLKSDLVIVLSSEMNYSLKASLKLFELFKSMPELDALSKKALLLINRRRVLKSRFLMIPDGLVIATLFYMIASLGTTIALESPLMLAFLSVLLWRLLSFISNGFDYYQNSGKRPLAVLESKKIPVFYELPCEDKTCKLAINEASLLENKTALGKALQGLAEKLQERLKAC